MSDTQFEDATEVEDELNEDAEGEEDTEGDEDTEDESSEDETADTSKAGSSGRLQLPEGIVSPIQALNVLKRKGLAPADHPPQRMYGLVKNPGKTDPFPVKHYDADGKAHATAQTDEGGHTITRPGVQLKEVVQWWKRADVRAAEKEKAKKEKAEAKEKKEKKKAGPTDEELDAMLDDEIENGEEYVDSDEAE